MALSTSDLASSSACSPMKSSDALYRSALRSAVGAVCVEAGYSGASRDAIETLTEMMQSFLTELTRSTKAYAEHSGRTAPVVTDVIISLMEMGQRVDQLPRYFRKTNRVLLQPPGPSVAPPELKRLQVGTRKSHKSHVMDYMPPFPDPHTYIKSATFKAPVDEYQLIREKNSAQKRDVEKAFSRFIAKTGDTENLFSDDPYAFPLIANKPKPLPYMDALLSKEADSLAADEDEDQSERPGEDQEVPIKPQQEVTTPTALAISSGVVKVEPSAQGLDNVDSDSIDNPYLRPIKMPKLKVTKKASRI